MLTPICVTASLLFMLGIHPQSLANASRKTILSRETKLVRIGKSVRLPAALHSFTIEDSVIRNGESMAVNMLLRTKRKDWTAIGKSAHKQLPGSSYYAYKNHLGCVVMVRNSNFTITLQIGYGSLRTETVEGFAFSQKGTGIAKALLTIETTVQPVPPKDIKTGSSSNQNNSPHH